MSKIEVLRVPAKWWIDETGWLQYTARGGAWVESFAPPEKPALLAALLEDAGAVKVDIEYENRAQYTVWTVSDKRLTDGPGWLLPIPEDTP